MIYIHICIDSLLGLNIQRGILCCVSGKWCGIAFRHGDWRRFPCDIGKPRSVLEEPWEILKITTGHKLMHKIAPTITGWLVGHEAQRLNDERIMRSEIWYQKRFAANVRVYSSFKSYDVNLQRALHMLLPKRNFLPKLLLLKYLMFM